MKKFIVQARFSSIGRLLGLGTFHATDEVHAIIQAAQMVARGGENAVEIVATEKGGEA